MWWNGRHKGLKIPRWQHCTGSSPVTGTKILPAPCGAGRILFAGRTRTGRRPAGRKKQSGGLFFSPRESPKLKFRTELWSTSSHRWVTDLFLGLGEFCLLVGLEQDGGTQKWAFTSSFRAKRGTIRREIPFLRSTPQLLRWIASLFLGAGGFCLQAGRGQGALDGKQANRCARFWCA